jgi:hypothetical protein
MDSIKFGDVVSRTWIVPEEMLVMYVRNFRVLAPRPASGILNISI